MQARKCFVGCCAAESSAGVVLPCAGHCNERAADAAVIIGATLLHDIAMHLRGAAFSCHGVCVERSVSFSTREWYLCRWRVRSMEGIDEVVMAR